MARERPLIVAGGGVIYSEATAALRAFVDATGIPVCETQAGRGALLSDHPASLGAVGATGTPAANRLAREADLVIGIGTRWSDFTTASKSAFQDPDVRFININVAAFDAAKHSGLPVEADARVALDALRGALAGWRVDADWTTRAATRRGRSARRWRGSSRRARARCPSGGVIGAINDAAGETGVVVCAAARRPATCTSSGTRAILPARATTSSTATRAWATRSPAAWASSSPRPSATSSCSSATART